MCSRVVMNKLEFYGTPEIDSVYEYQELDCYFIARGLSELLEENIDSGNLFLKTNALDSGSFFELSQFKGDSFYFPFYGDMLDVDSIPDTLWQLRS